MNDIRATVKDYPDNNHGGAIPVVAVEIG